jgi:tetratricopeptide (TPR) repeat protein
MSGCSIHHDHMRSRVPLLLAALLMLAAGRASAAPDEATKAAARSAFEHGSRSYNLGDYEDALASFREAYRISGEPAFLFNIGQCQRSLHHYEEAEMSFRAYLRESRSLPSATRDQVQKLIAAMEKAIEEQRAKIPPTGTVPPEGGGSATPPAVATPVPTPPAPAPEPPPPAPTSRAANAAELRTARTLQLAGYASAGLGVVGIVLGGVFTALASDANHHIVSGSSWSPATEDKRNAYQAADVAMFVVGGVALATGVTLWLVGRHAARRSYPVERVQLAPALGAHTAGLAVGGSF